jgi:queuine tRNA-ribosyltransferase
MMKPFAIVARDKHTQARAGILQTAHGDVETPAFMPVGTVGTVRTLTPDEVRALGAQIILGNTYHLLLRPGIETIQKAGGLHKFMLWDGPILTDSGGFQVFSLAKLRKISADGVEFQSHIDGATLFLGPREAIEAQRKLGSDIAMVLDECPPWPCDREYACKSLELSLQWAARCREEAADFRDNGQLLFGIVQGSVFDDLREKSARELVKIGFDGYAIGGVSVGEPVPEMLKQVRASAPFLPENCPRYVMGVGTPPQILDMIAEGVDMFDCALPTRVARNGTVFTNSGTVAIKNAEFREDFSPLEQGCACYACASGFSRAYIRHMFKVNEILAHRLMTIHNLHVYLRLVSRARAAILEGKFEEFRQNFVENYQVSEDFLEKNDAND